ncbi:hypothetical protein IE077_002381, partial [Cardiosporidium cionae]
FTEQTITNSTFDQLKSFFCFKKPLFTMIETRKHSEILHYFSGLKPLLNSATSPTSCEDDVFAVTQILEELLHKEWTVAVDQQCSKILEKALSRLFSCVLALSADKGNLSTTDNNSIYNRSLNTFVDFFESILKKCSFLVTQPYASHVLQTSLSLFLRIYQTIEGTQCPLAQRIETLFPSFLQHVADSSSGLVSVICNACGSHVIRSFLLVCGGYLVPFGDATGNRHSKTRKNFREEELPKTRTTVPQAFSRCILSITETLVEYLKEDSLGLSLDPYAAPVIELLLLILFTDGYADETHAMIQALLYMPESMQNITDDRTAAKEDTQPSSKQVILADTLAKSPIGSRVLEKVIECCTAEEFYQLFRHWMIIDLNTLAQASLGNYVLQKTLTCSQFSAVYLEQFIGTFDFKACREKGNPALLWRCAEACRRFQSCYKKFVRRLFLSFGMHDTSHCHLLWLAILTMVSMEECSVTLEPSIHESTSMDTPVLETKEENFLKRKIQPSGCSLLFCLLKFPPEFISPLLSGFRKFLAVSSVAKAATESDFPPPRSLLRKLATDRQGSRLLQSMTEPGSPISAIAIQKLIKKFKGMYTDLALNPMGGFLVTSFYKAAKVELKRTIAQELSEIKDTLKSKNYAVYKCCEIYKFQQDETAWMAAQTPKNKTRELFRDILTHTPVATEDNIAKLQKNDDREKHRVSKRVANSLLRESGSTSEKKFSSTSESPAMGIARTHTLAAGIEDTPNITVSSTTNDKAIPVCVSQSPPSTVRSCILSYIDSCFVFFRNIHNAYILSVDMSFTVAHQHTADVQCTHSVKAASESTNPVVDAVLFCIEGTSKKHTTSKKRRKDEVIKLRNANTALKSRKTK